MHLTHLCGDRGKVLGGCSKNNLGDAAVAYDIRLAFSKARSRVR